MFFKLYLNFGDILGTLKVTVPEKDAWPLCPSASVKKVWPLVFHFIALYHIKSELTASY